ncbi:MAG TPA: phosphotransferase [Acidimicrobiia bacterium]|nr:phosphotransferase [Acidimicrobiia bacterium]
MLTLPVDAADLSPAFLSDALGTDVTAVELLDHSFATNQRARVGLTYATDGAGPPSLFVKLAPVDPVHREMIGATGMGEREAQFYSDVAPTVNVVVPGCAFAASEGDRFVLLLEDLSVRGSLFASNGEWGITADAAAGALEDLAVFHARFEQADERYRVAPWLAAPRPSMSEATSGLMRWVLDENAGKLSDDYSTIGELYVEHHAWFDEIWHAGPATYIHGDTHIGNVYLDGDRVGFLDWGLSRTSTHLRDVSYFLTMSVDVEERRAHQRELLQGYLDALRAAGGVDISYDDAWAAHRLHASYTVVATFLAYMPSYAASDGVGLGDALLERSDAALADLDVVEAVRAALSA